MKKNRSPFYLILAYVLAQFAWIGLLGMWIYWYVSNYIIFQQVGSKLSPQIDINSPNVFVFVCGIILMVGIAVAMFFIFRNLTIQIKLTRLYDNFIANVTHELKSPLSSIHLFLETLISKNVQPEKQKEFFKLMEKDVNRLNKLISIILEISRLEQKRIAHNYHIFNADEVFNKIINESIENLKISKDSVIVLGNLNCKCVIDKDAMQIVFDNIIDNAVKYSVDKPEITINLVTSRKTLFIEICDKGIGLPINEQKKIFNKFYRVHNESIPNVKGTGLGLYWVKEIIKLHGGKISVHSDGINKGSCFKIELPIYFDMQKFSYEKFLKNVRI